MKYIVFDGHYVNKDKILFVKKGQYKCVKDDEPRYLLIVQLTDDITLTSSLTDMIDRDNQYDNLIKELNKGQHYDSCLQQL